MAELAVNGGMPVRIEPWPSWPVYGKAEEEALLGVLRSGRWYYAEKVKEFEEKFAAFQGARFGITTCNGTASLEAALVCCGVRAGDEVIIPAYTFVATADAVLRANAVPVFCDVELDTFNLDPEAAAGLITDKTRAIVPVHWIGLPCDMDRIGELAAEHDLAVVEDACHSWGSQWKGKGTGALGNAGGFSFQLSKNITAGEGGIALTDDEDLAELIRAFTNCGRGMEDPWYGHYRTGSNYRMTEFQAAILLAQLERLEEQAQLRAENAQYLNGELSPMPGLHTLREDERVTRRSHHAYLLRYVEEQLDGIPRSRILEALNAEGIPCYGAYAKPLYRQPPFHRRGDGPEYCPLSCPYYGRRMDYTEVECPNAERLCREAIWMAHSVLLGTRRDMEDIVAAFRKVYENRAHLQK